MPWRLKWALPYKTFLIPLFTYASMCICGRLRCRFERWRIVTTEVWTTKTELFCYELRSPTTIPHFFSFLVLSFSPLVIYNSIMQSSELLLLDSLPSLHSCTHSKPPPPQASLLTPGCVSCVSVSQLQLASSKGKKQCSQSFLTKVARFSKWKYRTSG